MVNEFINKLNNNEYISNHLYEYVLLNNKNIIPNNFNIDKYNEEVLDKLYIDNKEYFDKMYCQIDNNIKLDIEQCKAILADEKYSLIIAGAGTGKTTTMVSKVKYLVDKKQIAPNRILVMSYTRKTTEEIANKIEELINEPVHVTTFHSLGYEYIKEIFKNRKCVIIDINKINEIYLNYFREIYKDKSKIEEILNNFDIIKEKNNFIFSNYFINNYKKFDTYDEFVETYIKDKVEETRQEGFEIPIRKWINKQAIKDRGIRTIKGDYVKSVGEMIIANFLYVNGIDYKYEEVYDEIMDNNIIYRPDFTIDFGLDKIYIEYFGLDDNKYNAIKEKKIEYHKRKNNNFISIDNIPLNDIVKVLKEELSKYNIMYKRKKLEEIYEHILRLNPISQVYPFIYFLNDCLKTRKESFYRDNYDIATNYIEQLEGIEKEKISVQYKYILDYTKYYSKEVFGGQIYYFDFSDLLYYSVKYLEKITTDNNLIFDYIIIDEYQDISQIKYELTHKTAMRNDSKVSAVGDDWQSIYAFSGSRIEYIYKFNEYFKGAKSFNISKTYRNSQELINASGEFIMRNKNQIRKRLISNKHNNNPIIFKIFENNEIECLKNTILEIHNKNKEHNILVLGRTNSIIDNIVEDEELLDDIGNKVTFIGNKDINIDAMTMHKSKGLTYDQVILIGLNKKFPSAKTEEYWYKSLYKSEPIKEGIPFAEERRLFYVALTRTKNNVYLLCDKNPNNRSSFIKELYDITLSNKNSVY